MQVQTEEEDAENYTYMYGPDIAGVDTGYLERGVNSICVHEVRTQNFDHTHKLLDHAPN